MPMWWNKLAAALRNAGTVLTPIGVFFGAYQLRERAFTQMQAKREEAYRRFERPFTRWSLAHPYLAHLRYPHYVTALAMAEDLHHLYSRQGECIRAIGQSSADSSRLQKTMARMEKDILLLDAVRREARRYVKSEVMFEEPNSLDLQVLASARINLHDLEEEACQHLSNCFFVACALDAAEACFVRGDPLFMLNESEYFGSLRSGDPAKNLEGFFNARAVAMWRIIFEKNLEIDHTYILSYWSRFRKNPHRYNKRLTCSVASMLRFSFGLDPPTVAENQHRDGFHGRLVQLAAEVEATCALCERLDMEKREKHRQRDRPFEGYFPVYRKDPSPKNPQNMEDGAYGTAMREGTAPQGGMGQVRVKDALVRADKSEGPRE